ncbi:MAG TPA: YjgN family protein [Steroidobacteraceae bacterium]|nr:YjgN family protein [Steroidobacteraceae bacterium]
MPLDANVANRTVAGEQAGEATRYRPEFRGAAQEYFRIWIVNLALTILTLGIYSAWAKVRKLRYFYGNTVLAGSAFGYHGAPLAILKGRLIAAAVGVAYFAATQFSPIATLIIIVLLALAMPWLLVKSRLFAMRMTSWRGLRFTFREDYRGAYAVLLGWGTAAIVSLGLLIPYFLCERFRFVVTRTGYGDQAFACEPSAGRFYKTAFAALGITLGIIVPFVILIAAAGTLAQGSGLQQSTLTAAGITAVILMYVVLFAVVGAYVQSRNLSEVLNHTSLPPHRLHSSLAARPLIWIYLTNILGIVLTLGLYTPWAQIRLARYRLETTEVEVHGSLDAFVASVAATAPSATGEEISELFDADFGL